VPGDEGGIAGVLREQARSPAEDVGADHRLHRVEDARVVREVVETAQFEMALVANH
jgi:hypothetical protein